MPLPTAADMFGDTTDPVEIAGRFEAFKGALNKSAARPALAGPQGAPTSEVAQFQQALGSDEITKALSPELLNSVRESLAQADLGKDLLAAGPGSTGGLVAYDLEAPAKLLAPRPTPLRNRIARHKGVGTAHQFKRITGFTGTGTGGMSNGRPGITETGTNVVGGQTLRRPPVISYAGDQVSVPYIEFGASDSVSFKAQFSGMGYQDIRQLSQSSVLYSSMLQEERLLLGGRGTVGSFAGALAAPTGAAAPIAAVGSTGYAPITGYGTNLYVRVTSESVFGESVSSSLVTTTAASGSYLSVTANVPSNATGMRVYVGTGSSDPGLAGSFYVGRQSNGSVPFIIQGALPTTGANPPAADTSAQAAEYDGILTYCTGANSGYVKNIAAISNGASSGAVNGGLNVNNPGNEFQVAFAALYDSVKAQPQEILANGNDRKQLSDLLKTSSSSNYRITIDNAGEAHSATIGALVTSIQNQVVGDLVDVTVHPWLPQGTMPIVSWTLPMPDSNVSDVFSVINVTDYTMYEWPVNQLSYDVSSYWYGTFVCYAPSFCGAITGISKV